MSFSPDLKNLHCGRIISLLSTSAPLCLIVLCVSERPSEGQLCHSPTKGFSQEDWSESCLFPFFTLFFFFLPMLIIWSGFNSELDQMRSEHNHARASLPQRHEGGNGQGFHQKGPKVSRRIVFEMHSYRQRTSSICRQSQTSWAA